MKTINIITALMMCAAPSISFAAEDITQSNALDYAKSVNACGDNRTVVDAAWGTSIKPTLTVTCRNAAGANVGTGTALAAGVAVVVVAALLSSNNGSTNSTSGTN